MNYISNSHIEQRLGAEAYVQLTDDDGNGVADQSVVDEARLGAEGEVDSYLARRYQVPIDLAVHPELAGVLATVVLDIVEHRLRQRRPPVPDGTVRKRDHATEWLRRVASGETDLPSASGMTPNTVHGSPAATSGSKRTLSREELSGY